MTHLENCWAVCSERSEMRSTADIDKEWLRLKPKIAQIKGNKCFYCGKPAEEYHHIIPRHMGGDNRLENIVPMCTECHRKAHSKRSYKPHGAWGRPRIETPQQFDIVIDKYLDCCFSLAEALELTGIKRHTFYRMLQEYKDRTGDTREHRDNGIVRDGRKVR